MSPIGVNLRNPDHVAKLIEFYGTDPYYLRLARMAIHAMWEQHIIDDEQANTLRRKEQQMHLAYLKRMRVKPGAGVAAFGHCR